jgi:hypothetical protein
MKANWYHKFSLTLILHNLHCLSRPTTVSWALFTDLAAIWMTGMPSITYRSYMEVTASYILMTLV